MSSWTSLFLLGAVSMFAQTREFPTLHRGDITPQQSDLAIQVLNDLNLARNALGRADQAQAAQNVADALNAIDRVEYQTSNPIRFLAACTTVGANPGSVSNVDIDVNLLKGRLQLAQAALNNANLKAASEALNDAQSGVMNVSVLMDTPLSRAKHHLFIARDVLDQEQYREAKRLLEQAARDLYDYQAVSPGHAKDARYLSRQIRYAALHLNTNVVQDIDAWQQVVDRW